MSEDSWRSEIFGEPEPAPGPGEYWGEDHLAQAKTLFERGDFKRAFAKAVRAIEAWPTNWRPYVVAGDALSKIDEVHRSTEFYKDEDTPEGYYKSALLHEPPEDHRAWILQKLGELARKHGYHDQAIAFYEEAILYKPEWSNSWYHLAHSRSKVSGELAVEPLLESFGLDVAAVDAARSATWDQWRDEVDALIEQFTVEMKRSAEQAYEKAIQTISEAAALSRGRDHA